MLICLFDNITVRILWSRLAEASCVNQILTARAVAHDMGGVRASETGADSWAKCHTHHSERDVHRTVKRQKTTLDIPIQYISCSGSSVPWIPPALWLSWIVTKGLWATLSGCKRQDYDGSCRNWSEFWRLYKQLEPDHEVFDSGYDLSRTAAFCIHGDEGRTLKKNGIMITSLQSALGCGFDHLRVQGEKSDDSRLRVNYAGHSFTTRYVVNTIPKTAYEASPEVFHSAMDHVAKSLKSCLREGFVDPVRKEHFRIAIIAVKGDAPYLTKTGHFYRSYNTVAKRGEEKGAPKGICPFCLAGTIGFPAEELTTVKPRWLTTVGAKLPWLRVPAFIRHLPHNRANPVNLFKSDIWHVVHLGFGRSWIASVIQTAIPFMEQPNLDEKWAFMSEDYLDWCRRNKKQAHISKITPYLLSYGDASGAMGNWHKGALTTNFFLWLIEFLGKIPGDPDNLLKQCREATYRMNLLFQHLYRAGAFLTEEEGLFVATQGLAFLSTYVLGAQTMFQKNRQYLYPLYPKLHIFHHILLDIRSKCMALHLCENPLMYACQLDEDVVGRASRLSRRVSIRQVGFRTLQRYLISAYTAYTKAGLLG